MASALLRRASLSDPDAAANAARGLRRIFDRGKIFLIKQITQTAAQIGQGRDLKQRIALKGGSKDELHQLALTFDEMFERLDASFEAERQFTSDASHELRTPMAVIMAECEYMLEQERSSVEYEDALRVVYRQEKRCRV